MATKLRSAASNATKSKSAATLKRKYDDSDVSEYDDLEGDLEECVVCMEKIGPDQEVSSLKCKHAYHYGTHTYTHIHTHTHTY